MVLIDVSPMDEVIPRRLEDIVQTPTGTPIQRFFANRSVLITGATGFFGKVLIDKLLRSCPDIDNLYLLVRTKKGKNMMTRVDEIFDDPVFERLKLDVPKFRHKIVGVSGDISLPGLGLNEVDREVLTRKISVCFHGAATVRFDEKLKCAVAINVQGTREIINLCKDMAGLKALIHVSTAYSNCHLSEIDEKIYTSSISGENLIKLTECLDEKALDLFTPSLLKDSPNTYAFTKCVAEDIVSKCGKGIPMAIFRPAIVVGTSRDPVPGWIDNVYGPMGVVVGVGAGLIRTMHFDKSVHANIVPVDLCVNALIASAWDVANTNYDEIPVFNYVSSRNRLTWGEYMDLHQLYGREKPSCKAIWYYALNDTKFKFLFTIYSFLLHIVPAAVVDGVLLIAGKKPKLLTAYKKIHKFLGVITYFATREWKFSDNNISNLWGKLNQKDQDEFFFNIEDLDWNHYASKSVNGIRIYLFKDQPETIPAARSKMQKLKILHYTLKYVIIGLLSWLMFTIFETVLLS